ncbi:dorsal-ventral patterning protein Sog-like isoform X1 [Homarus americanus]|uniref:dorsal-ventral patterning protein Sog-like isoform X1 n=1 Tax=Homarus americanus TaxID=6706 RepID=UPI001C4930BF|nr:dorsal-ventral patterning protein Sog-like isoform X1 [Homarus americanus]
MRHSLGDEWSPNLGPPFGVWSCVKCICQGVQKKRRVVARVRCRNVKTECPKVTCRDPVILPGQCCKTCASEELRLPGDEPHEPLEELTGRDFAVLLNGRTSQTPMTTSRVATGRLFLRKKTLHFSFLLEAGAPPPASIQFLSETGDILEQLEAQPTPYEATNSRICGAWTRVPKEYRALLREEQMWVALSPADESQEDTISGQVARYVGVDTEVFSSLLTPPPTANQTLSGGGTAIISVDRKTDSLHVSLVFNGVFADGEAHNASLVVELLPERALDPVVDTVILPKVFSDLNRAEIMTTLGERSLIRLTRGQVAMKVWSQAAPELALEGMITPRATCNVFSAVLSKPVPDSEDDTSTESTDMTSSYGAGWALLTLSNGTFQYQVYVKGFEVSTLTLKTKHKRQDRIVENLTPFYHDSWANGTYDRTTYRDLDALIRGKLEVVVASESNEELRGMLNPVAVTEALRSPQPVLLSSPEVPMAATVWVAVDSACVTHYDVMVAGQPPYGAIEPFWNLVLREEDQFWDPRFKMTKMDLEAHVEGRELFAHSTQLTRLSLSRLEAGVSYLDLVLLPPDSNSTLQSSLSGLIHGVSVPSECLMGSDHQEVIVEEYDEEECVHGRCILREETAPEVPQSHRCIDEEARVFEDGKSWQSPVNVCSMCMCTRGKIKCQDVICHRLDCEGAYTPPNQCCQVCPGETGPNDVAEESKMCELNDQKHLLGSKWHPFLTPKGFDKCVTCTCLLHSSGRPVVNCSRFPCPPLPCGPDEMEPQPDSCCAKCRTPRPEAPQPTAQPGMVNEGELVTEEEHRNIILGRGGCLLNNRLLYENGAEWHPRVASIGYYKCVTCKCKDSNITCAYHQCPTLRCQAMIQEKQECCPRCANENSTINHGNKTRWLKPYIKSTHKNKNGN